MSKPGAKELLDAIEAGEYVRIKEETVEWLEGAFVPAGPVLAARVEKVLAACKIPGGIDAYDFARRVERILNGEEP